MIGDFFFLFTGKQGKTAGYNPQNAKENNDSVNFIFQFNFPFRKILRNHFSAKE